MVVVGADTRDAFAGIAAGDAAALEDQEISGLDGRTSALVRFAALVAVGSPASSYARQVHEAIAEGVTPEDLLGALRAVAPQVGGPRVTAASADVMAALGLPPDQGGAAASAPS